MLLAALRAAHSPATRLCRAPAAARAVRTFASRSTTVRPASRILSQVKWPAKQQTAAGHRFYAVAVPTPSPGAGEVPPAAAEAPKTEEAAAHLVPRSVGIWLMSCSVLVLLIVVVGGITRLTESGLSITEWRPVTGIMPPRNAAEWEEEFNKYKETPEFKLMNHHFTLAEFKKIFYMEWAHRVLGRLLGVYFLVPFAYFAARRRLDRRTLYKCLAMGGLIGVQGAMGWYMVKSGLEDSIIAENAVPRVSHYRLTSHLALAFVLYAGMFYEGMAIIKDWKYAHGRAWSGLPDGTTVQECLKRAPVRSFLRQARWATALVFVTALSGALVAGLDAGLLYNEWPYMGNGFMPPKDELLDTRYSKSDDRSDLWWRSILENPVTVQFDHRNMAYLSYTAVTALAAQALYRPGWRAALPRAALTSILAGWVAVNVQVILGITTLIYIVPTSTASQHQLNSMLLLSAMFHTLLSLRRPSAAAQAWRAAAARASTK
ncbi:cytochrome oxidase assembly protein-domain-containing protein [Schizophyllum amplum]|uniref:Cytochrome oxidase assembly protein-domain-containing protein n=1 Tax=Schizophyllum amplum TaxID=97359 RepID=A0A550CUF4_9AGAR|nr:cytochrome oxidase assembly protein-domain-containing protein [Auriculariopsis ampla]